MKILVKVTDLDSVNEATRQHVKYQQKMEEKKKDNPELISFGQIPCRRVLMTLGCSSLLAIFVARNKECLPVHSLSKSYPSETSSPR